MAMSMFARTGLALAALIVGLNTAGAAEATRLGTYKYWTAWTSTDQHGKICYISSNPQDKQPADLDHGDIFFFVLHREKAPDYSDGKDGSTFAPIRGEVQAQMSYSVKPDGSLSASIDGKTYTMVAENKSMWLTSRSDEPGFVNGMKAGTTLVVKSTSGRGNNTSYTFSLSGVTAAMAAIDKACP